MTHALIVDDSRLACKVLADMLQPLHISSVSVYSAEQALQHLQSHSPDLIFLDHSMQGMNGLQTLQVIKSNPKTATIPVMMYTAQQGEVYVGQARALGAVDVLPKGMEKDHLHNALKKLGVLANDEEIKTPEIKNSEEKAAPNLSTPVATAAATADVVRQTSVQAPAERDVSSVPAEPKLVDPKVSWREFWVQTMEPYLHRQKLEQIEEVTQFGKQQTRYLNREMHKTMENFEHALVLRLESHDDFLEARRLHATERRRKWVIIGFAAVVVTQLSLFWQFNKVEESNQQLLMQQQQFAERQKQLENQLAQVKTPVVSPRTQSAPIKTRTRSITLQNLQREAVAEIFPATAGAAEYRGVTTSGYEFYINAAGEISRLNADRFYLTQNCQGDVFIEGTPAQLFKESDGSLWFVDKAAEEVVVNVNSQLTTANQCLPLADELKTLVRLQRNSSLETGIDELDTLRLVNN